VTESIDRFNFRIVQTDDNGQARAGEMVTAHGSVRTPVFMPVGSQATVKTVTPEELDEIGIQIVLANSYHLYLRPGTDTIERLGGLHRFMNWEKPMLTDSGGYQIFSLARLTRIADEGATFRSHIDGSEHFISPERAIQIQESLGADIIMALDEVPSPQDNPERIKRATERTLRWAERCQQAHTRNDQALFAIVQGGLSPELRRESARRLISMDFAGYAIGGLSLGEPKELTQQVTEETASLFHVDKPRYLMGVGSPEDLVTSVALGIDMFDCVLPTRLGRNGAVFTREGRRNIRNTVYSTMQEPVEEGCDCYTCRHYSTAYLHHLFKCEELLAYRLATIHNLRFMSNLMRQIREAILSQNYNSFKDRFLATYQPTDENTRMEQKKKWLKAQNNLTSPERERE
jgi:queuine tRNA-ribosyltransferase